MGFFNRIFPRDGETTQEHDDRLRKAEAEWAIIELAERERSKPAIETQPTIIHVESESQSGLDSGAEKFLQEQIDSLDAEVIKLSCLQETVLEHDNDLIDAKLKIERLERELREANEVIQRCMSQLNRLETKHKSLSGKFLEFMRLVVERFERVEKS